MIEFIKTLLGLGPATDLKEVMDRGAQLIDVRTAGEFRDGHIRGAVNIPLHTLNRNLSRIRKDKPVITCCASGVRSASAKSILKSNGFNEVYNGGGWTGLQGKLSVK